MNGGNGRKG